MTTTLIQMAFIMGCGMAWRYLAPAGLSAEHTRTVLTTVVYYLFLPAMVLEVLWKADLGMQSFQFSILGVSAVLFGLALTWWVTTALRYSKVKKGALILAAGFPNVTYLGLPVLEQTYGSWARSVAIQLDFFAAGPLLFTLGIIIARFYGKDESRRQPMYAFLSTPPFLAAITATCLNQFEVPAPDWLFGVFEQLSTAVVPMMLFSLGLALRWQSMSPRNAPFIIPALMVKLALMPLAAWLLIDFLPFEEKYKAPAILDLAMPCMVLGIVFCDRYKLDASLYAMAVTVSTLLSLITLPYWHQLL